ncbi:MarR family winged helix-turn-helix transcriptional regulator [Pseudonocardia sp. CA-107938]|uniref:MarR family winged helix-turn-helix transcriptional regulator n=1 Tax=Pseudonocardia sp. CA-107938 TaxID=3240021 RepID=UPI003D9298A6
MTTPQQLEADFGWALLAVLRSYREHSEQLLAELPGGPRGYHVLAIAALGEPPSQLAMARKLGVDRTVMTYLLDDLESAGLIERRPDPADRRARRITITEAGSATLCAMQRSLRAAEDALLEPLEPAERDVLRRLLYRLASGADPTHEHTTCTEAEKLTGPDAC